MKAYIDYLSKEVTYDREDVWYQDTDKVSKLSIYVRDNLEEPYYVSIAFLRPDKRVISTFVPDAMSGDSNVVTENGIDYRVFNFTLGALVLKVAGSLNFSAYINFTETDENGNIYVSKKGRLCTNVNTIVSCVKFNNGDYVYTDDEDTSSKLHSLMNDALKLMDQKIDVSGFAPSRLSVIPNLDVNKIDKSKARLYVDYDGENSSVSLEDIKGSQVNTVTEIPANAKAGEYYFKEVN